MLCSLIGHKYERRIAHSPGGRESSSILASGQYPGGGKMTVKIKWCYRCENYITPPMPEHRITIILGDSDEQTVDSR